jgi:hypothetical protein
LLDSLKGRPKNEPPACDYVPNTRRRESVADQHLGKIVVYIGEGLRPKFDDDKGEWQLKWRGYHYSSGEGGYLAFRPESNILKLAHELGHYFHLPHPFGAELGTVADAAMLIREYVEGRARAANKGIPPAKISTQFIDDGLAVLDGDRVAVTDTPPDVGQGIFQSSGKDPCNQAHGKLDIPVTFSTGQKHTYVLEPDRENIMNYWDQTCRGLPARITASQANRVRHALEIGNRKHLITAPPTRWLPPPPSAVSWGLGRLDVFAFGHDTSVRHRSLTGASWHPPLEEGWNYLAGATTDSPAVASWGSDRFDIFVRGRDGQVWRRAWTGTAWFPEEN